ncbi:hypothetical protein [Metabacillus halosaccharovorans]|uniref:hypothetical protein n=1 Tax=Metabacillus halosaccharovorans TaxID=930124 RepID=UPI0009955D74|nr:hypothetical protein [Metabacillus halosaccharovorans]
MYNLHLTIGEHHFFINTPSIGIKEFFRHNYLIQNRNKTSSDLTIYIEDGYGLPFVDYDVSVIKTHNEISYKRADYLIKLDHSYKNAYLFIHDELALKHALMNLYSSFIVHQNWGLLIHSSCAINNGMAHIFTGHSGAGKSTVARLSYPRELLADEATIVKITSNDVVTYDSPFRSELNGDCFPSPFKLKSIHLLNQSVSNSRERLPRGESLLQLMDKVFYWTESSSEARKIFKLLHSLVNQVPVYDLYFQKNNTFWEMIS